jgi:ribose 5-phosphate isomerase B
MTRLAVGADHAGFRLKELLSTHLRANGHEVLDFGTHDEERVDYPDYGAAVGRAVVSGEADLGLLVCGSGIGICIAANKIPGVRAATVHDVTSGHMAREHNDANIICLGERFLGEQTAIESLDAFVGASFQGGRHTPRVAKIDALLPVVPTSTSGR